MTTPGPGNDRSLTADEARVWELIEKDLRLRARRRHRIAGFAVRCVRRPVVVMGLLLMTLASVVAGAAALPTEAALVVALVVAGTGLGAVVVGALSSLHRTGPAPLPKRTRRGLRRRRTVEATAGGLKDGSESGAGDERDDGSGSGGELV